MTTDQGHSHDRPGQDPAAAGQADRHRLVDHEELHRHITQAVEKALHCGVAEQLARIEKTVSKQAGQVVVAGRRHVNEAVSQYTPAWLRPTQGEPRWPMVVAVLMAIGLQLAIPRDLVVRPQWLLPGLEFGLLAVLVAANPRRLNVRQRWIRVTSLVLVGVASAANVYSAARLIWHLVHGTGPAKAGPLLVVGATVWLTNVIIFALWYWEFDRGGPATRAQGEHTYLDFLFPQMQSSDGVHPDWEPMFVDYLYLSFTNATAFSPTDTMPMSRWAKMMMMAQSVVSLVTVALVIARAVNILS